MKLETSNPVPQNVYKKLDDPTFVRHRRSLIAFSVGLLVFVLAGGEVSRASILGGSVDIRFPSVLYVAALLSLLYLRWQYQIARPENAIFQQELSAAMLKRTELFEALPKNVNQEGVRGPVNIGSGTKIEGGLLRAKVTASRVHKAGGAHSENLPQPISAPVKTRVLLLAWAKCFASVARHGRGFIELVLPDILYYMALFATIAYFAFLILAHINAHW